jgi:signal transduction histidine kinase
MKLDGWLPVVVPFVIALVGSLLPCSLAPQGYWREVLPSLFYLPVVVAAINLGTRAAVSVALAAGVAHGAASLIGCGYTWVRPFTETILFVSVGLTAATLTRMHASLAGNQHALSQTEENDVLENTFRETPGLRQFPAFGQMVNSLIRRFRTPLSSIEGASWLLEDKNVPAEKHDEFVKIIRRESHLLDRALSDIQEFTQPRRPRICKTDVSRLLDEVIEVSCPRVHSNFYLFRKDIPSTLPPLKCDPEQISKALMNLAMNAIQATPEGGQLIWTVRAADGKMVISLRDFGRGIPSAIVDRIFDPFFTTHDSGLGLGLTVARQIAVAHGGTISVDDISDRGASLSLTLPLNPPITRRP